MPWAQPAWRQRERDRDVVAAAAMQAPANIALRPATEQDTAFLSGVYRSVREPELQAMGWMDTQIGAFCDMQHRFRTAGYAQYLPPVDSHLVLKDATPVGLLAVCRSPERWVLVNIELLPVARGQGVGARLIAQLQQEAAAAGVGLQLQAASSSPVVRLYERCGFSSVADDGMVRRMVWPQGKTRASTKKPGRRDANEQTVD